MVGETYSLLGACKLTLSFCVFLFPFLFLCSCVPLFSSSWEGDNKQEDKMGEKFLIRKLV